MSFTELFLLAVGKSTNGHGKSGLGEDRMGLITCSFSAICQPTPDCILLQSLVRILYTECFKAIIP